MNNLITIAAQFKPQEKIIDIQEYGHGNINNTFLVTLDNCEEKHFILQRINTKVFLQPELVMQNICNFSNHAQQKLSKNLDDNYCYWQVPHVLFTNNSQNHWLDREGSFWRAISFIDNAQSFDIIQDLNHAQEIGYGLGTFHNLISDLSVDKLADTLEGFHITPRYFQHYREVLEKSTIKSSAEGDYCLKFIESRADCVNILENAKAKGRLPLRPIHGDPKINNIMMDKNTEKAIAMVDLDTVKPGLVHYDIGDCLRSGCNILGEETRDWEKVSFDLELAQAILQGYLSVARSFLTEYEYEYLYEGIRLIAFELGLRFFTDYLEGDIYFKIKYPEHNLARALVQFKLTESIESQKREILNILQNVR
ncbi:MAG: aminoglycoside phosphotransferase family protein [Xenococcaceae cyanobacterium MO_188.B29]|nr:aminoglycoside phosphotransferase family protein [Xenococcaceae cyanobacterium MO_188.B29]